MAKNSLADEARWWEEQPVVSPAHQPGEVLAQGPVPEVLAVPAAPGIPAGGEPTGASVGFPAQVQKKQQVDQVRVVPVESAVREGVAVQGEPLLQEESVARVEEAVWEESAVQEIQGLARRVMVSPVFLLGVLDVEQCPEGRFQQLEFD